MAAGDFIRLSGPVNSKAGEGSLAIPVNAAGHAAGNTVVVGTSQISAGAASGVTDSKGNTYTQAYNETSDNPRNGLWYSVLGTALVSGDTITVTYGSIQNRGQVHMAVELEGTGTFDSPAVETTGSGTSLSSGNKTPASAPAVAVGWLAVIGEGDPPVFSGSWTSRGSDNSGTAGATITNLQSNIGTLALSDTSAVAATGTISSSADWSAGIAVFTFGAAAETVAIAASLQVLTLAATTDSVSDLAVAGVLPALTLAATTDSAADVAVAASLPGLTLAAQLEVPAVDVAFNADLPALTLAAQTDASADVAVAGTLPALGLSATTDAAADVAIAATLPPLALSANIDEPSLSDTVQIAASLPALDLDAALTAAADVAVAASLPALELAATVQADTGTVTFAGSLPALELAASIDADANVTFAAELPALELSAQTATGTATVTIGGTLPGLELAATLVVGIPADIDVVIGDLQTEWAAGSMAQSWNPGAAAQRWRLGELRRT